MLMGSDIWAILFLLTIHYIFDFIFQMRDDAENKHKRLSSLTSHVYQYYIATVFTGLIAVNPMSWSHMLYYAVAIALLHFVTDYITSKLSHYYHSLGETKLFWAIIGIDQLFHQIQIIICYVIFLQGKIN